MGRALAPSNGRCELERLCRGPLAYERIVGLFRAVPEDGLENAACRPRKAICLSTQIVAVPPGSREPVLRGVSFSLKPGEILGVLGSERRRKMNLARRFSRGVDFSERQGPR